MRRRIIWMPGVGFAYLLMWSKAGYDSTVEVVTVALVGAIIGLLLAHASEQSGSITDARLKIAYWPLALVLFVCYPTIGFWWGDRGSGIAWMWKPFSIAAAIGLLFGVSHWFAASRKLLRPRADG
jgi:hypothetical protein